MGNVAFLCFALILHAISYLETYLPGGHGMLYLTTVASSTYHVLDAVLTT